MLDRVKQCSGGIVGPTVGEWFLINGYNRYLIIGPPGLVFISGNGSTEGRWGSAVGGGETLDRGPFFLFSDFMG